MFNEEGAGYSQLPQYAYKPTLHTIQQPNDCLSDFKYEKFNTENSLNFKYINHFCQYNGIGVYKFVIWNSIELSNHTQSVFEQ